MDVAVHLRIKAFAMASAVKVQSHKPLRAFRIYPSYP